MKIEKVNPDIKYLYHYTLKKNVEKILNDEAIISKDEYVFFTGSLKDSILAFEREMMQEGKLYIDLNGVLRKREKCNKEDYCILKIPYKNDNKFCKFKFENQSKESIYTISIVHKGAYKFKNAKVIEFPKNKRMNIIKQTAVAAVATGILLFPYNTFAASWLDTNNYDTSWYTEGLTTGNYVIETKKEMAGLAYLVNNQDETFEGKEIEIRGNIDLRENTWQTISDIFKGTICGSHRIILNLLDGKLIKNINVNDVKYSLNVLLDNTLKQVEVTTPYTVRELKIASIYDSRVFLNNQELPDNKSLFELNLNEENTLEVITGMYIFIENEKGEKVILSVESGDSIDNIKEIYSTKTNISKENLIIKYKDKELEDGRTLADYNIQKEETIQVYLEINNDENTDKKEEIPGDENADKKEEIPEDKKIEENENIEVKEEKNTVINEVLTNNPKTGDSILSYLITFVLSFIGIVITNKIKRKK